MDGYGSLAGNGMGPSTSSGGSFGGGMMPPTPITPRSGVPGLLGPPVSAGGPTLSGGTPTPTLAGGGPPPPVPGLGSPPPPVAPPPPAVLPNVGAPPGWVDAGYGTGPLVNGFQHGNPTLGGGPTPQISNDGGMAPRPPMPPTPLPPPQFGTGGVSGGVTRQPPFGAPRMPPSPITANGAMVNAAPRPTVNAAVRPGMMPPSSIRQRPIVLSQGSGFSMYPRR